MPKSSMKQKTAELDRILETLRGRDLPLLRPARVWDAKLTGAIEALTPEAAGLKDGDSFQCLRSGLHLWNDDLDRAHRIAQEIGGSPAGHWHGIMHRREGDYGNSRYWFRKVGASPVFPGLLAAAQLLAKDHPGDAFAKWVSGQKKWDPIAFIGACEKLKEAEYLRNVQIKEFELLLGHCREIGND